jgi:hypothetical protein
VASPAPGPSECVAARLAFGVVTDWTIALPPPGGISIEAHHPAGGGFVYHNTSAEYLRGTD